MVALRLCNNPHLNGGVETLRCIFIFVIMKCFLHGPLSSSIDSTDWCCSAEAAEPRGKGICIIKLHGCMEDPCLGCCWSVKVHRGWRKENYLEEKGSVRGRDSWMLRAAFSPDVCLPCGMGFHQDKPRPCSRALFCEEHRHKTHADTDCPITRVGFNNVQ